VRATKKKAPAKDKKPEEEKTVIEKVQDAVTEQVEAVKEAVVGKSNGESAAAAAPAKSGPPKVGDTIDLASFGGEIETNDGDKTTLAKLVEESKGGVVLFTYPKASTPGCKPHP
jgi:peroxiredoxin Q/BCP